MLLNPLSLITLNAWFAYFVFFNKAKTFAVATSTLSPVAIYCSFKFLAVWISISLTRPAFSLPHVDISISLIVLISVLARLIWLIKFFISLIDMVKPLPYFATDSNAPLPVCRISSDCALAAFISFPISRYL